MKLTSAAKVLYDLMFCKDFSLEVLRTELESGKYTADDVNLAAYTYVDDCQNDLMDEDYEIHHNGLGEIIAGYESSHLLEVVELLLQYGLDPNKVYDDECNIMDALRYIDNGYQAADALILLVEHGGNPCLILDGTSIVRDADFDLGFDLNEQEDRIRYDAFVHYWMALIGCGGRLEDGTIPFDPCGHFDVSNFKNHRQYYYGAIHSERSNDHWEICFFDKDTNWEVGRY